MKDHSGRVCAPFDGIARRVRSADLQTIGFTGAVFGEGASTLALGTSLALAALQDGPVVLIDANWKRPSLTSDAGASSAPGLAEVLGGSAALDEVLRPTGRARLSFLPAGKPDAQRPSVDALVSLLERVLERHSLVVADLPPALEKEPLVHEWASALEQLFIVVRSGVTPLALVRRAVDDTALEKPQLVLNRTPLARATRTSTPQLAAP